MLFWILSAVLTAGVAGGLLLYPGRGRGLDAAGTDEVVFVQQLRELEDDIAAERISADDARAMRAEIARRLLRARRVNGAKAGGAAEDAGSDAVLMDEEPSLSRDAQRPAKAFAASVAGFIAVATTALYLVLGTPNAGELIAQSAEAQRIVAEQARARAVAAQTGGAGNGQGQSGADYSQAQIGDMVKRVEAILAERPDDARGWQVLAPIYMRMGRFDDAAMAISRLIELRGDGPAPRMERAIAIIYANDGTVTERARRDLKTAVDLSPEFAPAHYWLAIADMQSGKLDMAQDRLKAQLRREDVAGSLREAMLARLEDIQSGRVGAAVAPTSPQRETSSVASAPDQSVTAAGERPTRDDGAFSALPESETGRAIAALPAEDRGAMIESMVAGLKARLTEEGGSPRQWAQLVRALLVLNRPDEARSMVTAAQANLGAEAFRRSGIGALLPDGAAKSSREDKRNGVSGDGAAPAPGQTGAGQGDSGVPAAPQE